MDASLSPFTSAIVVTRSQVSMSDRAPSDFARIITSFLDTSHLHSFHKAIEVGSPRLMRRWRRIQRESYVNYTDWTRGLEIASKRGHVELMHWVATYRPERSLSVSHMRTSKDSRSLGRASMAPSRNQIIYVE